MKYSSLSIYVFLLFLIIMAFIFGTTSYLVLYDEDGRILKYYPVREGERFTISFIHSSELEPWDNTFVIEGDNTFSLEEIKVPSTGPGVPSVLEKDWEFKIENGTFIYNVANQNYQELKFIISKISPHHLFIKGQDVNLVDLAGDWATIKITLRKGTIPYLKEGLK